jgi:HEPN domain-containing protein
MSLENLARIGRLKAHVPVRGDIVKLLNAAARNLRDAANTANSKANRYTCAYTAIMQSAQVALFANGFRPGASESGHHMTMVQSLVHSIGLEPQRMQVLDALRRKRNVIDYVGDEPEAAEVEQAIEAAIDLLADVRAWLASLHPHLI